MPRHRGLVEQIENHWFWKVPQPNTLFDQFLNVHLQAKSEFKVWGLLGCRFKVFSVSAQLHIFLTTDPAQARAVHVTFDPACSRSIEGGPNANVLLDAKSDLGV